MLQKYISGKEFNLLTWEDIFVAFLPHHQYVTGLNNTKVDFYKLCESHNFFEEGKELRIVKVPDEAIITPFKNYYSSNTGVLSDIIMIDAEGVFMTSEVKIFVKNCIMNGKDPCLYFKDSSYLTEIYEIVISEYVKQRANEIMDELEYKTLDEIVMFRVSPKIAETKYYKKALTNYLEKEKKKNEEKLLAWGNGDGLFPLWTSRSQYPRHVYYSKEY